MTVNDLHRVVRAAHEAVAQDARRTRAHLTAIPGGRPSGVLVPGTRSHVTVHPSQQPADPAPRAIHVTPLELSLIIARLRGSESQSCRELADDLLVQWERPKPAPKVGAYGRIIRDDCDPHGIPRPDGAS